MQMDRLTKCFKWLSSSSLTAVQDERQKNKDRDGDYECSSAVNEEMPVEKILEAEIAVEHRTDLHSDATSSVST